MNIFFTSFTEGKVGNNIGKIYMPMNTMLSERLASKNYGDGLKEWFLMFVVVSPGFPGADEKERTMYKKKDQSTDFRLFIDYEKYKNGNQDEQKFLICECVLRSLDILKGKKIPNFDVDTLIIDVESIAQAEGWARP